jgi:hypothetical protein
MIMRKVLLAGVAALSVLSASAAENAFTPTLEMAGQGLQCGKTKIIINSDGKLDATGLPYGIPITKKDDQFSCKTNLACQSWSGRCQQNLYKMSCLPRTENGKVISANVRSQSGFFSTTEALMLSFLETRFASASARMTCEKLRRAWSF